MIMVRSVPKLKTKAAKAVYMRKLLASYLRKAHKQGFTGVIRAHFVGGNIDYLQKQHLVAD